MMKLMVLNRPNRRAKQVGKPNNCKQRPASAQSGGRSHADGRFQFVGYTHKKGTGLKLHQNEVVHQHSADQNQQKLGHLLSQLEKNRGIIPRKALSGQAPLTAIGFTSLFLDAPQGAAIRVGLLFGAATFFARLGG